MRESGLLVPAILLFSFLLSSCSSDGPTEPEPEPTPGDELLVQTTVGAVGDTLAAAGVVVEIPFGALGEDTGLLLLREANPELAAEAPTYRLEGLPADFGEALTLRVLLPAVSADRADPGLPAGTDDDFPSIQVLLRAIPGEGDTLTAHTTLTATLAGDTLVADLAPGDYLPPGREKEVGDIILDLILTGTRTTARSSVQIPLPIYVTGDNRFPYYQELFLQWLVEDASRFLPLTSGFEQNLFPSLATYMPLVEGTMTANDGGRRDISARLERNGVDSGTLVPHIYFAYSPEGHTDLATLRRLQHFTFWRRVYEARTGIFVDWWMYATAYALSYDIDDELPELFHSYAGRILRGLPRVMREEDDPYTLGVAPYGYGMIQLARWIDNREGAGWGREAIGRTVAERHGYGLLDTGHLGDALPGTPLEWWPAFLADLLTCGIQPCRPELFTDQEEDSWLIDGPEDTSYSFSGGQYYLDANLYRIYLHRDDFDPAETLRLTVTDPRDETVLLVFSVDDTGMTFLDSGTTVEVDNLDGMAALDEDLLVVTANAAVEGDFENSHAIVVSATLTDGAALPDITTFTEFQVTVTTDNTYSSGYTYPNENLSNQADVTWTGTGLNVAVQNMQGHSDTVYTVIDPETLVLSSWFTSAFYEAINGNEHYVRLAGGALAPTDWGYDEQWGTAYVHWAFYGGDQTCDLVSAVEHAVYYSETPDNWLTQHDCHDGGALYDMSKVYITALRRDRD